MNWATPTTALVNRKTKGYCKRKLKSSYLSYLLNDIWYFYWSAIHHICPIWYIACVLPRTTYVWMCSMCVAFLSCQARLLYVLDPLSSSSISLWNPSLARSARRGALRFDRFPWPYPLSLSSRCSRRSRLRLRLRLRLQRKWSHRVLSAFAGPTRCCKCFLFLSLSVALSLSLCLSRLHSCPRCAGCIDWQRAA